jgi:hypothetical protein
LLDFPAGVPSASGQSDSPLVSPLTAETMTLCIPFLEAMPLIPKDQASLPNDEVAVAIVDPSPFDDSHCKMSYSHGWSTRNTHHVASNA